MKEDGNGGGVKTMAQGTASDWQEGLMP